RPTMPDTSLTLSVRHVGVGPALHNKRTAEGEGGSACGWQRHGNHPSGYGVVFLAIAPVVCQKIARWGAESHKENLKFFSSFCGRWKGRKMQQPPILRFGPYRLDPANARLWRGEKKKEHTPPRLLFLAVFL